MLLYIKSMNIFEQLQHSILSVLDLNVHLMIHIYNIYNVLRSARKLRRKPTIGQTAI